MDGQCQDEFLHCTDPGLEQERINVAFRWIRHHVASCPFLRIRSSACCLPTCAQGSFVADTEFVGNMALFGRFWVLFGSFVYVGGTGNASLPPPVHRIWADAGVPIAGHSRWAEVVGRYYLCSLLGVQWFPLKCALKFCEQ